MEKRLIEVVYCKKHEERARFKIYKGQRGMFCCHCESPLEDSEVIIREEEDFRKFRKEMENVLEVKNE